MSENLRLFRVADHSYEWWIKATSSDVVLSILFRDYGCSLNDLGDGLEEGIIVSPVPEDEARSIVVTNEDSHVQTSLWDAFLEEDHEHMVATTAPF